MVTISPTMTPHSTGKDDSNNVVMLVVNNPFLGPGPPRGVGIPPTSPRYVKCPSLQNGIWRNTGHPCWLQTQLLFVFMFVLNMFLFVVFMRQSVCETLPVSTPSAESRLLQNLWYFCSPLLWGLNFEPFLHTPATSQLCTYPQLGGMFFVCQYVCVCCLCVFVVCVSLCVMCVCCLLFVVCVSVCVCVCVCVFVLHPSSCGYGHMWAVANLAAQPLDPWAWVAA
jgi:hypothetical protein